MLTFAYEQLDSGDMKNPYEIDVKRWKYGKKYYGGAKQVDVVNTETGEVVDVAMSSTYKPRYSDATRFVKVYDPLVFTQMSKTGVGVLAYVMTALGYGSIVSVSVSKCMEMNEWESSKSVYNGLNELLGLDVIRRNPDLKGTYYVNPNVLYRGDRRYATTPKAENDV